MAANASGNSQQLSLQQQHENALMASGAIPGPYQAIGTTMGAAPAQGTLTPMYNDSTWGSGSGTGTIAKADGTMVANPFGLTTEQIYWALSGHPDAIRRLAESLGATGGQTYNPATGQWEMNEANKLFHQIVNYYEAGGGGFNGGGYTAADAAKAAQNYSQGMGESTYTPMNFAAGIPVYGSMADAAAGNLAGYATGQGSGYSATGAPTTGGGTAPGTTPGAGTTPGTGTTTPGTGGGLPAGGGSTQYGNTGDTGGFPMASAAPWAPMSFDKYVAPTRPESTTTPFDFFDDEGYQFRLKEGLDAIENRAAAGGGLQSGNTLKALSKYASGLASDEYGAAFNRYDNSRRFSEGQFQSDRGFGRDVFTGDRSFDYGNAIDARNYNNSNRQWDTTFNNANRIDARNFDYGVYTGDRDFNEGQRRWDLGFNYNAAVGDRDFESGNSRFLATLGANANNNYANAMTQLATLLSQLEMKGAGASATGDIGAGNTLSATIQQILATLGNYAKVNNPTTP